MSAAHTHTPWSVVCACVCQWLADRNPADSKRWKQQILNATPVLWNIQSVENRTQFAAHSRGGLALEKWETPPRRPLSMDDSQGDIETFRQWCRLNLLPPSLCPPLSPQNERVLLRRKVIHTDWFWWWQMKWKNETKRKPKHKRGLHRSAREERNIPFSNLPTSPALDARSPIIGPRRWRTAISVSLLIRSRSGDDDDDPIPPCLIAPRSFAQKLANRPPAHHCRGTIGWLCEKPLANVHLLTFILLLPFPVWFEIPPRFLKPSKPTTWRRENYSTHTYTQPHGKA